MRDQAGGLMIGMLTTCVFCIRPCGLSVGNMEIPKHRLEGKEEQRAQHNLSGQMTSYIRRWSNGRARNPSEHAK